MGKQKGVGIFHFNGNLSWTQLVGWLLFSAVALVNKLNEMATTDLCVLRRTPPLYHKHNIYENYLPNSKQSAAEKKLY